MKDQSAVAEQEHRDEEVIWVDISSLRKSRTNPRKVFNIDEIAETLPTSGMLQPIVARHLADGDEIAFGERRFLAAKKIGWTKVPVVFREMTDAEVERDQIIENLHRAELHPLEEADACRRLQEEHGQTVEEIAAALGKPASYIRQRMKFGGLCAKARKAFLEGKLVAATALVIARIPDQKLQEQATEEICLARGWAGAEPMSPREASAHVQRTYMLLLSLAPFDITSVDLVVRAGSCAACPKRTGNQRELFADVESADVCTDPGCYQEKVKAGWAQRQAAAKEKGLAVVAPSEAKKIWPNTYSGIASSTGYVDLDAPCLEDPKRRPLRKLLKKKADEVVVAVAKHPHNDKIVELAKAVDVKKALKAAGHDFRAEKAADRAKAEQKIKDDPAEQKRVAEWAKRDREADLRRRVEQLAIAGAAKQADYAFERPHWQLLFDLSARMVIENGDLEDIAAFKRWDIVVNDLRYEVALEELKKRVSVLGGAAFFELAFQVLLEVLIGPGEMDAETFGALCKVFGLERKTLEAQAKVELKEEETAKGKAGAAKKKEPTATVERACRECGCTENTPCPGGCSWVEQNLCSACLAKTTAKGKGGEKKPKKPSK